MMVVLLPCLTSYVSRAPLPGLRRQPFRMMVSVVDDAAPSTILGDDDEAELANGIICARGVCVLAEEQSPEACYLGDDGSITCEPTVAAEQPATLSFEYLWPRILLLGCSVLYGTNFPLGRIMNEGLPASASTSARMLLAALALSPFLRNLAPELRWSALLCSCFTALGYVTQSLALVDTPAATVAFLGALTVIGARPARRRPAPPPRSVACADARRGAASSRPLADSRRCASCRLLPHLSPLAPLSRLWQSAPCSPRPSTGAR